MKLIFPDYYQDFQCIADRCNHSCCIGWEIDIDKKTFEWYQKLDGEFANRIRQNISMEDTPHFLLREGERCPFLNEKNLCDIILHLGEDALCQICTDHPRFRNFYTQYTEIGLGLCCEAAGDLILRQKEPFRLPEPDANLLTLEEIEFFDMRKAIFVILQDRSRPLTDRIQKLCENFHLSFPKKSYREWAEIFLGLEHLEPQWCERLEELSHLGNLSPLGAEWEIPIEQLLCYFIYRHLSGALEDGRYGERILFSVLCTFMVYTLSSMVKTNQTAFSMEQFVEIARLYSSEIEYSEENTEALLELFIQE